MSKLAREARAQLILAISERYRRADKTARSVILDEFVAVTGFHRKHAIRVLNGGQELRPSTRSARPTLYDEAVRQSLVVLREASDRICGKRLKPLIPLLIESLERHGHLNLDSVVRSKLLKVSAATIDRLLAPARHATGDRRRPSKPRVRASIPVRTAGDRPSDVPGFVEADLVAHCGGSMAGSFVHTLVLTDVATGWVECLPIAVRDASIVLDAVRAIRRSLPFPLQGLDTDNGTEFVNAAMKAYCDEEGIEFTRSRPYRKNDQAWVEQKNGAVVRRMVGYGRLEGVAAAESPGRLYSATRLFVNFYQPSFKLISKSRHGGRTRKQYETPTTPAARLAAHPSLSDEMKYRLRAVTLSTDPLRLLEEIRAVPHHIANLAAGAKLTGVPTRDADLDAFLAGLSTLWR